MVSGPRRAVYATGDSRRQDGRRARGRGPRLGARCPVARPGRLARASSASSGSSPGACSSLLLRRETPLVRVQTAVVVIVFATAVEYTFAGWLGVYVYRLDNVPWFVPPGHGLVYLGALALGRTAYVRSHLRELMVATAVAGGALRRVGALAARAAPRCARGVLVPVPARASSRFGRSRGLYVGAFVVVTYLEILGTQLGTWAWQPHDPTGLVRDRQPAVGGCGWLRLVRPRGDDRGSGAARALVRRARPAARRRTPARRVARHGQVAPSVTIHPEPGEPMCETITWARPAA